MAFAICSLSTVPIRNSSSHKSEMISQLLFGELVEILEEKGRQWTRIRCQEDNFVGWVSSQQIEPITPSEFDAYRKNFAFVLDLFHPVMTGDQFIPLTFGAKLPNFDGLRFEIGSHRFTYSGQAVFPRDIPPVAEIITKISRRFINAPFLWGGRSPLGVDGPGLAQAVFRIVGHILPRESFQQVLLGNAIDFVEQASPGDLAFFENRQGRVAHTGIILADHQIIHAYGKVRVDLLDHYGIYDREKSRYTHRLRVIKSVLPSEKKAGEAANVKKEMFSQQIELF